jgi:hypothetical protein
MPNLDCGRIECLNFQPTTLIRFNFRRILSDLATSLHLPRHAMYSLRRLLNDVVSVGTAYSP